MWKQCVENYSIYTYWAPLCPSRNSDTLRVWNIYVCVFYVYLTQNLRRTDFCNDLKRAIFVTHQTGKCYRAISKQFEVHL